MPAPRLSIMYASVTSVLLVCVVQAQVAHELSLELSILQTSKRNLESQLQSLEAEYSQTLSQVAELEHELASLRARNRTAEERLTALSSAPVVGNHAVQQRLVTAVATAVDEAQHRRRVQSELMGLLPEVQAVIAANDLPENLRGQLIAIEEALSELANRSSEYSSVIEADNSLRVVSYDAVTQTAIVSKGQRDGLRVGMRLQTISSESEDSKQLLVVETRETISAAIQIDEDSQPIDINENLQPVLETLQS